MLANGNQLNGAGVRRTHTSPLAGAPIRCVLTAIFFATMLPSILFAQNEDENNVVQMQMDYEAAKAMLRPGEMPTKAMKQIEEKLWKLARTGTSVDSKDARDVMIGQKIIPDFEDGLKRSHEALEEVNKRLDEIKAEVSYISQKASAEKEQRSSGRGPVLNVVTADDMQSLRQAYEDASLLEQTGRAIQYQVTRLQLLRMATYRQPPWDDKIIERGESRDYLKTADDGADRLLSF